jgi:hypothetical protein
MALVARMLRRSECRRVKAVGIQSSPPFQQNGGTIEMRTQDFAPLFVLTSALSLPGLVLAQFPYSAWTCETRGNNHWCSPALIPGEDQRITWGETPSTPDLTAMSRPVAEDMVTRFESAFSKIEKISQNFTDSSPEDANDTKALREEAHGKALQAMQSANLSLSDYNQVAAYLGRSFDLRMRVIPSVH